MAPNSDVSVVELLLDSESGDADENFFAASQPPMQLKVRSAVQVVPGLTQVDPRLTLG